MSLLENEAVVAPEVVAPEVIAPAKSGVECTRDTRGSAPCAVVMCEDCN